MNIGDGLVNGFGVPLEDRLVKGSPTQGTYHGRSKRGAVSAA